MDPCRSSPPSAAGHSWSSTEINVPDDDKTVLACAAECEGDQAPELAKLWGSRSPGKAMEMVAGEIELRRFQVRATRIGDGSPCVVLIIQRTSSWAIYGADKEGIQLSGESMISLAKAIVKHGNDADSPG